MKRLVLLLFGLILLPLLWVEQSQAQDLEFVRPADFRYHVVVDGDTLSTRSLEYKALQDGIMFKYQYPNSTITVQPTGIEIRGTFPVITEPVTVTDTVYVDQEVVVTDTVYVDLPPDTITVTEVDTVYQDVMVTDTVYVDRVDTVYQDVVVTDTVYVELPPETVYDTVYVDQEVIVTDTVYVDVPAERPLYEDLMTEYRYVDALPPYNVLTTDVSSVADSLHITYTCGDVIENQYNTDQWNVLFSHSYTTTCTDNMEILYRFWDGDTPVDEVETIPSFLLQGSELTDQYVIPLDNADAWTQHWDMSSTLTANGTNIIIEDTTSGSNVWINESVPTATEMEVYMVASTASSTPHIRMLATPYGYAQDMYYTSGLAMPDGTTGGLQYAYWNNTDPTVPWSQSMYTLVENIPVAGDGDPLHMLMRVEANTVYIKAWFGDTEPTEWLYTSPVPQGYENIEGSLGIGAHSVATRNIEYLSVGINGESAPRR